MKPILLFLFLVMQQPQPDCTNENYTELEHTLIRDNPQWFDLPIETRLKAIEISQKYISKKPML